MKRSFLDEARQAKGVLPSWFTHTVSIFVLGENEWQLEGFEIYAVRSDDQHGWRIEDRSDPKNPRPLAERIYTDDECIEELLKIRRIRPNGLIPTSKC